jgi:outer membrane protein
MWRALIVSLGLAAVSLTSAEVAAADESKIAYINIERILLESKPARKAQSKLESEFKGRENEIRTLADRGKQAQKQYETDLLQLTETDKQKRQKELGQLQSELLRRTQNFEKDLAQRQDEERTVVIERMGKIVRRLFETRGYDLVLQDAVFVNPRIDITDEVIRELDALENK